MNTEAWQQWQKRPEVERTLPERARGNLPEMESTKQLVRLVSDIYRPGMRVLDVGCNVGHYLRGLRRLDAALNYTGMDAYAYYIEQAQSIFANDPHATFKVCDVFRPLSPDDPFDIVYCCNVILHLPDFRVPVQNLLASAKNFCLIRTLLGDYNTIVKRAMSDELDGEGNPKEFIYQNTWRTGYFVNFIEQLGWRVELIPDEFDVSTLQREYDSVKQGSGTRVVGGKQADGNVIFNWMWVKATRIS